MSLSTDAAATLAACRRALANGTNITGAEIRVCIDTIETLINTTDSKAVATTTTAKADAIALAAAMVTALAAWTAVGAGDSSAVYTTQEAILTPLKLAVVASTAAAFTAGAASVTDVTANDKTDGRFVA